MGAWRIAEPWFLTAFKRPEGPQSPLYVDVATTDRDYLEASDKRFRDDHGAPMLCRTRAEMIAAGLRHRGALRAWNEGTTRSSRGTRRGGQTRSWRALAELKRRPRSGGPRTERSMSRIHHDDAVAADVVKAVVALENAS